MSLAFLLGIAIKVLVIKFLKRYPCYDGLKPKIFFVAALHFVIRASSLGIFVARTHQMKNYNKCGVFILL